ncbi:MAG TPA: hypothetical protein VEN28_09690 [Burkholderiaceae bacterium]|nr:hypothetical protein [Burkholderiaceae bacterium]
MLASLAALISRHPSRLLGHLQLYGDLVSAETTHAMRQLMQRLAYVVLAIDLLACAVTLAGIAVLLAALDVGAAEHWALWAVPAVPLTGALLAWLKVRESTAPEPFATLRRQAAADAQWLANRELGEQGPPSSIGPGLK